MTGNLEIAKTTKSEQLLPLFPFLAVVSSFSPLNSSSNEKTGGKRIHLCSFQNSESRRQGL